MQLFVATASPQSEDDFSWTVEGELVHLPIGVCDCPECGCERSMCGLSSHRATTTFVVRDVDMDLATFEELLWDSLLQGGWVTEGNPDDRQWVKSWATEHVELASRLPTEKPLNIRGEKVNLR